MNLGCYVGVPACEGNDDFDFDARLTELHKKLEVLNSEAHELEERIPENIAMLLEVEVG